MREKLSAFVIAYNRASLLETCLRAVSFADELIVVDKSSTDNSAVIAARYADRVEVVPWSPTVEETRAFALSLCRHEWVMFLDDDEILSPETGPYLRTHLSEWDADILAIPLRHYILGVHDERAYYWPEEHNRLFRKGAIEFISTVHGGTALQSDRTARIPADSGVCIHHLSYRDVASWIERTNRYTGRTDRVHATGGTVDLIRFAHDQIDYWMQRTTDPTANEYPTAVALLRSIYDMVDRLKAWETQRGLDGVELFRIAQKNLTPVIEERPFRPSLKDDEKDHDDHLPCEPRGGQLLHLPDDAGNLAALRMEMQAIVVQLRAAEAQSRERIEAARRSSLNLRSVRNELNEAIAALAAARNDLDESRATADRTREMLGRNQTALDHARATLDRTRATLDQTLETLDQTVTHLGRVNLRSERLSGSARLFVRQYLPKLRRHLLSRLRHGPAMTGNPGGPTE
jgi:glycosyltransferase involved in cell wall biosynthesis